MSFTAPLHLTPDPKTGLYLTTRSFGFDVGFKGSGLRITVPENFPTDLASVPVVLWWLLPPHDPRYAAAVVLHDYLCTWRSESGEEFDQRTADAILYDALLILGVPRWKAGLMYASVRVYGEVTQNKATSAAAR